MTDWTDEFTVALQGEEDLEALAAQISLTWPGARRVLVMKIEGGPLGQYGRVAAWQANGNHWAVSGFHRPSAWRRPEGWTAIVSARPFIDMMARIDAFGLWRPEMRVGGAGDGATTELVAIEPGRLQHLTVGPLVSSPWQRLAEEIVERVRALLETSRLASGAYLSMNMASLDEGRCPDCAGPLQFGASDRVAGILLRRAIAHGLWRGDEENDGIYHALNCPRCGYTAFINTPKAGERPKPVVHPSRPEAAHRPFA